MRKVLSLSLSLSRSLISLIHQNPAAAQSAQPPQAILDALRAGQSVDLIVEFDDAASGQEASRRATEAGRRFHGAAEIAYKRSEFARIKQSALSGLSGITTLRDFENLPSNFVRVESEVALFALLARGGVRRVAENVPMELHTAQSLTLIDQVAVNTAGVRGAGQTVAVLDTGIDYQLLEFGSCTAPGVPAPNCRVLVAFDIGIADSRLDDPINVASGPHGTNVSGIVAAVAPSANLVVIDVTDGPTGSALTQLNVLLGLNWVAGNAAIYNIGAVNLSLGVAGNGSLFFNQIPCPGSSLASGLDQVLANGVQPIASAGNNAMALGFPVPVYQDGIADPACYPGAVGVGAVYDANVGSTMAYNCTDPVTIADQITCFSQSAPILALLAPGANIVSTVGGPPYQGTSQAAPHVSGAWAVMRAAMPNATHAEILAALQAQGTPITDIRNNVTTSRIDLFDALDSEGPGGAGDGILFPLDNCTAVANGAGLGNQIDSDGDGCGNRCDGDFDNTGFTSIGDFTTFKICFTRTVGAPGGPASDPNCLESDMDGSGAMSIGDFTDFKIEFTGGGGLPGPSGLPSAAPGTACTP